MTTSTISPFFSLCRSGTMRLLTLAADAVMAHFGVDGIGKINGRGFTRQRNHFAFGREAVHFVGIQIDFQVADKFPRDR